MPISPVKNALLPALPQMLGWSKVQKKNWRFYISKQIFFLSFTTLLLLSSIVFTYNQYFAQAANPGAGNGCSWYKVHWGDTLTTIARNSRSSLSVLASANAIRNVNLIFVGQSICIPRPSSTSGGSSGGYSPSGILSNGDVRWYNYTALQWSTRPQVAAMLRQAAANYGLPANLLLAIAWQESGWYQHVIAKDGGIGVMQLMPYTAKSINIGTGIRRDPYHLWDNINLGATYLRWLWNSFHGNLSQVISAYNEGGWSVIHRGIFNWSYVNSVLSLMRVYR